MNKWIVMMIVVALQGCSSQDPVSAFDDSLYSGKPVDSLSSSEAPKPKQKRLPEVTER